MRSEPAGAPPSIPLGAVGVQADGMQGTEWGGGVLVGGWLKGREGGGEEALVLAFAQPCVTMPSREPPS